MLPVPPICMMALRTPATSALPGTKSGNPAQTPVVERHHPNAEGATARARVCHAWRRNKARGAEQPVRWRPDAEGYGLRPKTG
jgi:hypothetical protein